MNYVDNPFKSPAVISFCPGILGIERGLARAGVHCRVAAYVEIEAFICANLVAGMEAGILDPTPIWTDAKTFDARPFRGRIHGIIGGYPCPGESTAGLREGHLYKGFIWPAIRRSIAAARPLWCFFENVDDHLTGTYPIVQRSLHNMGYHVEADVYTAEEVGAPHERQRLFILALANDLCQQIDWHDTARFFGITPGSYQKMVNPQGISKRKQTDQTNAFTTEGQAWNEPGNGSSEMGNGHSERLPRIGVESKQKKENNGTIEIWSGIAGTGSSLWPAGQGYFQYEWEAPRTVEPGMGCTTHGYNFREDLLRALGNSVVPQSAEIAFLDLLKKHYGNLESDKRL